jgi:hypothetical protein
VALSCTRTHRERRSARRDDGTGTRLLMDHMVAGPRYLIVRTTIALPYDLHGWL